MRLRTAERYLNLNKERVSGLVRGPRLSRQAASESSSRRPPTSSITKELAMNPRSVSTMDDLKRLTCAAVERALAARQAVTSLDAEQTDQVGGGLPPAGGLPLSQRQKVWTGILLPSPKPADLI